MNFKRLSAFIFFLSAIFALEGRAWALGECGLSCCLTGASVSGVSLADTLGVSVQYEYGHMKTIKDGATSITANEAIFRKWTPGSSFSVPERMSMEKLSLILSRPVTSRLQVMGVLPYVRNSMEMRTKSASGTVSVHKMNDTEGLGDLTLLGLYTLHTDAPIRPTERLTVGIGLKTPTGDNDRKTGSGSFTHAMMQPGTGSWDPLFMVNYMRAFYPVVFQANLFYHLTTEGDEGYEYGDQLTLDLIVRSQISDLVNIGAGLNGIYSEGDKDREGKYTSATSLVDNTDNTGLYAVYLTPGVQVKIPNTGGSLDLTLWQPLYQRVNGIQQVLDWRVQGSIVWNF